MIELVPLVRQFQSMKQDILQAMADTIDSGKFILGPNVQRLESDISAYLEVSDAIGVANGTDALVLTLDAYGIGPGDEVITTPFTFFASAEAVSRVGATPVFADIDPQTYNIDPARIEEKITPATKAIIPVHLFGQPADMDEMMSIANKRGLVVIEDACQAFGAEYKGRRVGSIGHAACFSFFPTKNLGTIGDGGLITTSDKEVAQRIRRLRQHGSNKKYYHSEIGYNSRLDELHAAIVQLALSKIDSWNKERMRLAVRYREAFKDLPYLRVGPEPQDRSHIYHLFCIQSEHRDQLQEALTRKDIQSGVYYPRPLHLQEAYASLHYGPGAYPVSERLSEQLLALPMSPFLLESEQDQVIDVLIGLKGELKP
ncbi:DegT/DnrJ/EryC1/StrS family aminotransferase [Paenibacillus validus]|uniref:Aminotransferase class V-fold PLP-dependent enzyme n=1 Tax=Paenibacillus validus TaxID=44253 RepID=A0A7X2Z9V7_9BACL|nr:MULTISPECIES: DegT/DnrJ/EryC1/StrS family aminotransferase [Paenibacillus]MED4600506.1 DegT/DnrJ/EryC1/StrS family aminotransferase [Paenibacillus validus]MED4604765.1 DegT/DnrJ/EryC1/StrS family aminotransferase [Paenibacillus validus]MUG71013.1 aminotransferase class V-fold PLP-dependent enzyme [Paenibacillus validus]